MISNVVVPAHLVASFAEIFTRLSSHHTDDSMGRGGNHGQEKPVAAMPLFSLHRQIKM